MFVLLIEDAGSNFKIWFFKTVGVEGVGGGDKLWFY